MQLDGRELAQGTHGTDVRLLQTELVALGYTIPEDERSGSHFGTFTHLAVQKFQEEHGLPTTGVVNEATARRINAELSAQQENALFTVAGQARRANGRGLSNLTVRAFDKDLRNEELLGETKTNRRGQYQIGYSDRQFRRAEKESADLVVRAYYADGTPAVESGVVFNARKTEQVDLEVTTTPPKVSLYEKYLSLLEPALDGVALAALTKADANFLAGETGIDAEHIGHVATAARLAADTALPAAAFFGWALAGLGDDLDTLLEKTRQQLLRALRTLIRRSAIPASLGDAAESIVGDLEALGARADVLDGVLLNAVTGKPLAGYTVQALDLRVPREPQELGQDVSDPSGRIGFAYSTPRSVQASATAVRRFRFRVLDGAGELIDEVDARMRAGQPGPVKVPVELPARASAPLNQVVRIAGLRLPARLRRTLADQGIRTLDDIRRAGGLSRIVDSSLAGHPAVRKLQAHARLSLLPTDAAMNEALIDAGYTSPLDIAAEPRESFVAKSGQSLGEDKAKETHDKAKAQSGLLGNLLTEARAESERDGGVVPAWYREAEIVLPEVCECRDCEAAVGPAAYLADLSDYALNHMRRDGEAIGLADLARLFHQPFPDLLLSCEAAKRELRQVRVCCEILGTYLQANLFDDTVRERAQARIEAEQASLQSAYHTLLNEIGTSYDELRRARADADARESVAQRLAIAPDRVAALYLDREAPTERQLERLFGLPATVPATQEPVEDFALKSWRLARLRETWQEQDWRPEAGDEVIEPIIDPDLIDVADLKRGAAQFSLLRARRTQVTGWFRRFQELREGAGAPRAAFSAMLDDGLGIDLAELARLGRAVDDGEDVGPRLAELGLGDAAMATLLRILRTIEADGDPVEQEWDQLCSLLTDVRKHGRFAAWRRQERADGIVLGPDHFRDRPDWRSAFPPQEPPALRGDRVSFSRRRAWQATLRARIEQQQSVIAELNKAIARTEEVTLPRLRDARIMGSAAAGATLEERAKELALSLQLDTRNDGCRTTTRVAQAIETLQGFLFALRTGQFADGGPGLVFDDGNFEAEWTWIGSYAAWRSAMLVFLYPENALQPGLRRKRTKPFDDLLKLTRSLRFTPEAACKAARQYFGYFQDISDLTLQATCQVSTRIYAGECPKPGVSDYRDLFHMFARAADSRRLYWSAYDPAEPSGDGQGFWEPIPVPADVNVTEIFGAVPYRTVDGERFIYLFVKTLSVGVEGLGFFRLDLERPVAWSRRWSALQRLKTPYDRDDEFPTTAFIAKVAQQNEEASPPHIAIGLSTGIFHGRLDPTGTNWAQEVPSKYPRPTPDESAPQRQPQPRAGDNQPRVGAEDGPPRSITPILVDLSGERLLGVVRLEGERFCEFRLPDPDVSQPVTVRARFFEDDDLFELNPREQDALAIDEMATWRGAFRWPSSPDVYVFGKKIRRDRFGRHFLVDTERPAIRGENSLFRDLQQVPLHCMGAMGERFSQLLIGASFADSPRGKGGIFRLTLRRRDRLLSTVGKDRAAPAVDEPDEIAAPRSTAQLRALHQRELQAIADNLDGPESNLTYVDEAYYFVPLQLALRLSENGYHLEALDWFKTVYDYTQANGRRATASILHPARFGAAGAAPYQRSREWLADPTNPHAIAVTRQNAYARYTAMAIVRCLLAYADHEFGRDTAEAIHRARGLYHLALDLLDGELLRRRTGPCETLIAELDLGSVDPEWRPAWSALLDELAGTSHADTLRTMVTELRTIMVDGSAPDRQLANAWSIVNTGLAADDPEYSLDDVRTADQEYLPRAYDAATGDDAVAEELYLVATAPSVVADVYWAPSQPSLRFCVPPNPLPESLRSHAENNLKKIRTCRNLAGMERQLAPTEASAHRQLQPTQYRYAILIDRAKELVGLARQTEASYLSLLEKRDAEELRLLEARQGIDLARAQVQLEDLRVREAEGGVALAGLLRERALAQQNHYVDLLSQGTSRLEERSLEAINQAITMHRDNIEREKESGILNSLMASFPGISGSPDKKGWIAPSIGINPWGPRSAYQSGSASIRSSRLAIKNLEANLFSTRAGLQRRRQEWAFQHVLSQQDVRIGAQRIRAAEDQVAVARQQHAIAELQTDHAEAVADFLANKFTNVELYDWMSEVLGGVYAFFLQQAASVARLAERQLAFERQDDFPSYIGPDYWSPPAESDLGGSTGSDADERRGLTGSARLLQDLYRLDQYAMETDTRKLQLSRTISLPRLVPVEFAQFRQTGVLQFATPTELFDRDFPGHYLRLIKRVRVSLVALIPPGDGIKATLSSTGVSRVVIGGDAFRSATVERMPQSVALSSPVSDTGVFELDSQPELLMPFEGLGVDNQWEFRLPKASNAFDFRSIADILMTIDYTALDSVEHRHDVTRGLDRWVSADRPYSFRHEFADQWYDLHNPEQTDTPMQVRFQVRREDFPPNVDDLAIEHIAMYLTRSEDAAVELPEIGLRFTEQGNEAGVGGQARPTANIYSTRRVGGAGWTPIIRGNGGAGASPVGEWELTFPPDLEAAFTNEQIEDILFVVSFSGRAPEWPQ